MASRPGRIGLSEYTAQRLADLKARRAEADMADGSLASGVSTDTPGISYSSAAQLNAQLSSNSNTSNNNINHDRTASTPVISNSMLESHVRMTSATGQVSTGSSDRLAYSSDRPVEVVKPFDVSLQQQKGQRGESGSGKNGLDHPPVGPPDETPPPPPSSPCPAWKAAEASVSERKDEGGEVQSSSSTVAARNLFPTRNGMEQPRRSPVPSSRLISSLSSMQPSRSGTGSTSSLAASDSRSSPEPSSFSNNQANTTAKTVFASVDESNTSSSASTISLANRMRSLSPNVRDISSGRSLISDGSNQSLYSGTGTFSTRVVTPMENGLKGRGSKAQTNQDEEEEECLGFASLQDQIQRKAIKRGFDLTIMVVGETGLGKSTLITSMFFGNDLYQDRTVPTVLERLKKTVQVEKRHLEIEERGVKLRVTVVDTPGFNDSLNSDKCNKPVVEYIEAQMEQYLKDESGLNRRNIKDNRVHCCLYFISPYGRGLRQVDVEFMKCIHDKVNIVPVIAKADTLTPSEIQKLKATVLTEIKKHKIQIYEIPQCDSDDEEEASIRDLELRNSMPFAVIGSNATVEVNGKKVKGRVYPWGIVEVENPKHSDFTKLRQFLLSTHMQDLKDVTREVHYENFRANHIREQAKRSAATQRQRGAAGDSAADGSTSNTDILLKQKEAEIKKMQEMLSRMQAQMQK